MKQGKWLLMASAIAAIAGTQWALWHQREPEQPFPQQDTLTQLTDSPPLTARELNRRADLLSQEQDGSRLVPLPTDRQQWICEVVVIGGSLGGVAAAAHAMQAGAQTCVIELTPWLGGQMSSQGVSAIDESLVMRQRQNFSVSWNQFKQLLHNQTVDLPEAVTGVPSAEVADINSCWVGELCFPPQAGHLAAQHLLESNRKQAPDSRWSTSTAFKGAEFNAEGDRITAIYAVARTPIAENYLPEGRLSRELHRWYGWESDEVFEKTAIELRPPADRPFIIIDATDTGELVGWANLSHRLGAESQATTGEPHAVADNPDCTQAFTFPFVLAIAPDNQRSLAELAQLPTGYSKAEHRRDFSLSGFNLFSGRSLFHYRRIVSISGSDPLVGTPGLGDMTAINWNRGNDWNLMNPPLLLSSEQLKVSGQDRNWLGGLNIDALRQGENHALLFAEWLMTHHSSPNRPLTLLKGRNGPLQTASGLSMYPYIREGRRILGRPAYDDTSFMLREQDIRYDLSGGRDFAQKAVAVTNYAIDIHGCRYRNWEPSGEAGSAPVNEYVVKPIYVPLEAMIPQQVDNLLMGGKSIAVTHIVNAATRTHYGEWSIGGAAGAIAAYQIAQPKPLNTRPLTNLATPNQLAEVRHFLESQQLRVHW